MTKGGAKKRFEPEQLARDPSAAREFLGLEAGPTKIVENPDLTRISTKITVAVLERLRLWGLRQKPPVIKDSALLRAVIGSVLKE